MAVDSWTVLVQTVYIRKKYVRRCCTSTLVRRCTCISHSRGRLRNFAGFPEEFGCTVRPVCFLEMVRDRQNLESSKKAAGVLEEPGSELGTVGEDLPERAIINEDPVVDQGIGYRACRYERQ